MEPNHFLVLHTAHFANWRARRGGTELEISAYDGLAPKVKGLKVCAANCSREQALS